MRTTILGLSLALAAGIGPAAADDAGGNAANEQIVHDFIASWATNDVDKVLSYVTEDCFYHNVPLAPIQGKAKMREFLAPFFKEDAITTNFELKPEILQTVSEGSAVLEERIDHYVVGKSRFHIPVVGVYEIRDGKIAVWKDYFDMAQFQPVVLLMQALQK